MHDSVNEAAAGGEFCPFCREPGRQHVEDCEGVRVSGGPLGEPPVVEEVPVLVFSDTPEEAGPVPVWTCHTYALKRSAMALVYPPGSTRTLVTLLSARADKDPETVGRWAVQITRQAVRLVAGEEDASAQMRALLEEIRPTVEEAERSMRSVGRWLEGYRRDPRMWPPLDL